MRSPLFPSCSTCWSVCENSSGQLVIARCPTIPPCYGPPLPLRCARRVPIHPRACPRPPTRICRRRPRLCRARPGLLVPSLPGTSRLPHGRCGRRGGQRQRGVADHARGRCGGSSRRLSTAGAPAVPGARCHARIPQGKGPRRPCARGAGAAWGSASTRLGAAPVASGRDAPPPPRQRSGIARGSRPQKKRAASKATRAASRARGGHGIGEALCEGCGCRWRARPPLPLRRQEHAAGSAGSSRCARAWSGSGLRAPPAASRWPPGVPPRGPGGWRASPQRPPSRGLS
jgi:hypothetical protein